MRVELVVGAVCDQHILWERKSWEMEINGCMMTIARRQRQGYEWEGCERAEEYTN